MHTLITGYGIYSCLGQNIPSVTVSLASATPGYSYDPSLLDYGYQCPFVGRPPIPTLDNLPRSTVRRMAPQTRYAYAATLEALQLAGLLDHQGLPFPHAQDRLAHYALIVSCDSSSEAMVECADAIRTHNTTRAIGSTNVFRALTSNTSMLLAQLFHLQGLSFSVSAACAGGGHALGLAHSLISAGTIDAAIVVGAQEASINAFLAFDALGILATPSHSSHPSHNSHPSHLSHTDSSLFPLHSSLPSSIPFDSHTTGIIPSGGAATIILESPRHYSLRHPFLPSQLAADPIRVPSGPSSPSSPSGPTLPRLLAYGFSTSPHLITPSPTSYALAMSSALRAADDGILDPPLSLFDLSFIHAHATGTLAGDLAEAEAIKSLTQEDRRTPPILSTKSLSGHECWMAGVSQPIYALLQSRLPHLTPNPFLSSPQGPPLPHVTTENSSLLTPHSSLKSAPILLNAFGFGGTNSSLIISPT